MMMKYFACLLFPAALLTISSCTSPEKKIERQMEKYLADTSAAIQNSYLADDSTDESDKFDCVRGQAVPIVRKSEYPNTTFVLQPDSISGIETVGLDNGDTLIIENTGCEYYVLNFRFETSRFQHDTADLGFWFKVADRQLMTSMLGGINKEVPIDIKRGLMYLENDLLENPKDLELGKQIDFGSNDIRSFISVDKISKLSETRYAVEISFATGPL